MASPSQLEFKPEQQATFYAQQMLCNQGSLTFVPQLWVQITHRLMAHTTSLAYRLTDVLMKYMTEHDCCMSKACTFCNLLALNSGVAVCGNCCPVCLTQNEDSHLQQSQDRRGNIFYSLICIQQFMFSAIALYSSEPIAFCDSAI